MVEDFLDLLYDELQLHVMINEYRLPVLHRMDKPSARLSAWGTKETAHSKG